MDWTGLGLTLVFSFLAYAVKDMPQSVSFGGIALGLALIAWKHLPFDPKYNGAIALAGIGLVLLAAAAGWAGSLSRDTTPRVALKFVYPASPALVLVNGSGVAAKQIKWTVLLWNLDNPRIYSVRQSDTPVDAHEPLQIPISTFDFIASHSSGGPQNLFGSILVAPYVKHGDRLVGSASVVCPDCDSGHTYVVSIVYGKGGWYSELEQYKKGEVVTPRPLTTGNVTRSLEALIATIPTKNRIAITDEL